MLNRTMTGGPFIELWYSIHKVRSVNICARQLSQVAYRTLYCCVGREIDEYGNVVKSGASQVKTLAANVAVERANKKKENPYLAHRAVPTAASSMLSSGLVSIPASAALGNPLPHALSGLPSVAATTEVVDERLPQLRRDLRARKALHFIEAGTLVDEAEKIKAKEERKIIAGYASGRKNIQHQKVRYY